MGKVMPPSLPIFTRWVTHVKSAYPMSQKSYVVALFVVLFAYLCFTSFILTLLLAVGLTAVVFLLFVLELTLDYLSSGLFYPDALLSELARNGASARGMGIPNARTCRT